MRTDSTRLADEAVVEIRDLIKSRYGDEYVPEALHSTPSEGAQDAHGPCSPLADHLPRDEELLSSSSRSSTASSGRTLASQMSRRVTS
jgi:DNA topoisomerase-1